MRGHLFRWENSGCSISAQQGALSFLLWALLSAFILGCRSQRWGQERSGCGADARLQYQRAGQAGCVSSVTASLVTRALDEITFHHRSQRREKERGQRNQRPVLKAFDPFPHVGLTDQLDFPISPIKSGKSEFTQLVGLLLETWSRCSKSPEGYSHQENLS